MSKIRLPDEIFGRKVDGAIERVLQGDKNKSEVPEQTPTKVPDLNGFIYVPSANLYFSKEISDLELNWEKTHKKIIAEGYEMPTPKNTWDLIFHLKNNLNNQEFRSMYDDILKTTPGNTWHGEWQNAIFSREGNQMYVQRVAGLDKKGEIVLSQKEKLEACLTQDGWADISKTGINSQGLCKTPSNSLSYSQGDNLYFWYPRNGAVAGFVAGSDGALLDCDWRPDNSYTSLGVRLVVRPKGGSPKLGVRK